MLQSRTCNYQSCFSFTYNFSLSWNDFVHCFLYFYGWSIFLRLLQDDKIEIFYNCVLLPCIYLDDKRGQRQRERERAIQQHLVLWNLIVYLGSTIPFIYVIVLMLFCCLLICRIAQFLVMEVLNSNPVTNTNEILAMYPGLFCTLVRWRWKNWWRS
jgi:hypothetical protein